MHQRPPSFRWSIAWAIYFYLNSGKLLLQMSNNMKKSRRRGELKASLYTVIEKKWLLDPIGFNRRARILKTAISIAMEDSTLQLSPRQIMQKKASTTMGCGMQLVCFLYFYLTTSAYVALFCGLPLQAKRMRRPEPAKTPALQASPVKEFDGKPCKLI